MADPIRMTVDDMKQVAAMGAKMECIWASNLQGVRSHLASQQQWKGITTADYAKAMREVGIEHFVLSSDLGQYLNPIHTDGMKAFILGLREEGFSDREIYTMARDTPSALLDLE